MSRNNARKAKSRQWWQKHRRDPFVKQAQKDGYRSRASYKLLAIQKRFDLIHKGDVVIDLGCVPGGWSELARDLTEKDGLVISVDKDPMKPLEGVSHLVCNINDDTFLSRLTPLLHNRPVACIISDIAPDTIGHAKVDRIRMASAIEEVWYAVKSLLSEGGSFALKIRDGALEDPLRLSMKQHTKSLRPFKPDASRSSSSELYIIGQGFQIPSSTSTS